MNGEGRGGESDTMKDDVVPTSSPPHTLKIKQMVVTVSLSYVVVSCYTGVLSLPSFLLLLVKSSRQ